MSLLHAGAESMAAQKAAGALANLASNTMNKDRIRGRRHRPPRRLAPCRQRRDGRWRPPSTLQLCSLTCVQSTNKDAIREAGGIGALVSLLCPRSGAGNGRRSPVHSPICWPTATANQMRSWGGRHRSLISHFCSPSLLPRGAAARSTSNAADAQQRPALCGIWQRTTPPTRMRSRGWWNCTAGCSALPGRRLCGLAEGSRSARKPCSWHAKPNAIRERALFRTSSTSCRRAWLRAAQQAAGRAPTRQTTATRMQFAVRHPAGLLLQAGHTSCRPKGRRRVAQSRSEQHSQSGPHPRSCGIASGDPPARWMNSLAAQESAAALANLAAGNSTNKDAIREAARLRRSFSFCSQLGLRSHNALRQSPTFFRL